jgi:lysine-specific demethylase 3
MADEAEWIEAEAGNAGAGPPAPGGGEEIKRKRGRPKGSVDSYKRRTRRAGDPALAVSVASLGDLEHSSGCISSPPLPSPCTVYTVRDGAAAIAAQSMAEGVEAEAGNAGAAPAPGGGEETKRKGGRPKGSLNKNNKSNKDRTPKPKAGTKGRRRRRTSDRASSVPAVSLGDLGRGVAAGIRLLRERRPAPNAFFDWDSDSDTEVSRFCSSSHIRRAMNFACSGVSPSPASYALATGFLFLNG